MNIEQPIDNITKKIPRNETIYLSIGWLSGKITCFPIGSESRYKISDEINNINNILFTLKGEELKK